MERGQDWCLECGTAAPGRLGARPGMRAAATVVGLTLALVGGAVAASYAALSTDAQQEAGRPAPPSGAPVAQVPPAQPAAPATDAPPAATPPGATTPPVPTVPGATPTTPKLPSTPATPRFPAPSVTPSPSPSPTTTTTPPAKDDDAGSQADGGSGDEDSGDGTTTTTPADPGPQPIELAKDAAGVYDPSARASEKGDAAKAVDDDAKTAWTVTTTQADRPMAVGLVLDLKEARSVRVLELATSTPGFRAEIYASDSDELPPDILDTRWAHIKDRSNVDGSGTKDKNKKGDGKERIVLGGGTAKYRYVLLWLTTPPEDGPTVRISDVKLSG